MTDFSAQLGPQCGQWVFYALLRIRTLLQRFQCWSWQLSLMGYSDISGAKKGLLMMVEVL
ncbi:MAG: hypothetical protein HRT83_05210 [Hyphomicrobiaceae bacterium]|nr:hypothetical protein [Hyphomicrobiaceae bacterium]